MTSECSGWNPTGAVVDNLGRFGALPAIPNGPVKSVKRDGKSFFHRETIHQREGSELQGFRGGPRNDFGLFR